MFRYLSIVLLAAFAQPAAAQDLSYSFIQGGYQEVEFDVDGSDVDGDGFSVGASVELGDQWFAFGGYGSSSFDFDVDLDELALGIGFHAPIGTNVDLVADLSYVRAEAEAFGFSVDDDGFGASLGIRGMVAPGFELAGSVNYIDLSDSGDDTSVSGSAWYYFTPEFAAGVGIESGDDVTAYGLSLRYYFGR